MPRLRCAAAAVLLALVALGLAASAGAALAAGGGCCAAMHAAPERGDAPAPCRSLTASACCDANASGPPTPLPGTPALAWAGWLAAGRAASGGRTALAAEAPGVERASLATPVLRL